MGQSMMRGKSLIVISSAGAFPADAEAVLGGLGWEIVRAAMGDDLSGLVAARLPAAVIADAPDQTVAAIRALPPPANGTPVIALEDGEASDGEAVLARLRDRAGPLEDHGLRAAPYGARYRLIRLVGLEAADGMIGRFHESLREALDLARRDPGAVPAHRLAGIAGMVGEGELSTLWSRVDRGEADSLGPALAATRRALEAG